MANPHEFGPKELVTKFGNKLAGLLLERSPRPGNELWDDITPEESAIARAAILRAQFLRNSTVDSGDAYLLGMARGLAIRREVLQQIPEPRSASPAENDDGEDPQPAV